MPQSVAIGDFNGDGRQDLATANFDSDNVSIRLGDGLGGFSGTTIVAVGDGPYSVAIGDFNGDGWQDLATANYNSDNVSIRFGDGLGGFSGATTVAVSDGPISVAIGDFNGDGRQDLATANFNSDNVSIRLGDGLGGFSGTTTVAVGDGPISVAIGDFNGDARQDLAIANQMSDNVSIRLGDGMGGFSGTTTVGVGNAPYSVAIGDFNGDGRQDWATANLLSWDVSIRLGDGMGGFSGTTTVGVGEYPQSVAIGDFNGDGRQDLATANSVNIINSGNVSIRLGDGLGGFSGTTNLMMWDRPSSVAIGDFNGDGLQDLITTPYNSANINIRLGVALTPVILGTYPNTSVTAGQNTTVAPNAANAASAVAHTNTNFTGLLSVNPTTGVVTVTDAKPAGIYTVTVTAFNIGGMTTTSTFTLTVTNPACSAGNFSSTTEAVGDGPLSIAVGDFNGDDKQDIAVANANSSTVSIRLGNGAGGFTGSTSVAVAGSPRSIAVGDFNGDGKQDFAVTIPFTNIINR